MPSACHFSKSTRRQCMCTVASAMVRRTLPSASTPLLAARRRLGALARRRAALLLGEPCQSPCNTRRRAHADLRRGLLRQRGPGDRRASGRRRARITPTRRSGTDPNAEHPQGAKLIMAGGDRAVRRRPVRVADRQPDLRLAGDPRHVRARARGRRRALVGARRGHADGLRQPAARPRPDRDARHLRGGDDDLGGGAVPARAARCWPASRWRSAGCFKQVAPYALLVLVLLELGRVVVAPARPGPARGRLVARPLTRLVRRPRSSAWACSSACWGSWT